MISTYSTVSFLFKMLLLVLYGLPLFNSLISAARDLEAQFDYLTFVSIPKSTNGFTRHLEYFDNNLTTIATDYLTKNSILEKQKLIYPKIQNLKVSIVAMQGVIYVTKNLLLPFLNSEKIKQICDLYKKLRIGSIKFEPSTRSPTVPKFLETLIGKSPFFSVELERIRRLHIVFVSVDNLSFQIELKHGVIEKVDDFYYSMKATGVPIDQRIELKRAISMIIDYSYKSMNSFNQIPK